MRRLVPSVLLLCAIGLGGVSRPAGAQAAGPARSATAGATRALLALEDSWAAALVKRDGSTFERLLAPGFVYTENAALMSRADVLKEVVSGADTVTAARNEGMEIHLFGTTGVVTGWLIVQGRGKGARFEHRYRFTDTWVRRNGKWQIVAAQDYLQAAR